VTVAAFAPAKINLYLHILGQRADGFHLLDSLVAFADIGDRITGRPASELSLTVGGPLASSLAELGGDNLVLRAARLLAQRMGITEGAALHLEKNLPVGAGLGGGSSDAAATLRALVSLWRVPIAENALRALGAELGADVPACLQARPAWVGGIGENVAPAGNLPRAGILLVNPGIPLPTVSVFRARAGPFGGPGRFGAMPRDVAALAEILRERRNDLAATAIRLVPDIRAVLDRLSRLSGALLAQMSGSGASCFALFADRKQAEHAAEALASAEPVWWIRAGVLADMPRAAVERS